MVIEKIAQPRHVQLWGIRLDLHNREEKRVHEAEDAERHIHQQKRMYALRLNLSHNHVCGV